MSVEVTEETFTAKIYPKLEESPEFREAVDNRSKTIEDVIDIIKQGTLLWKVRSLSKWYRRKYYFDDKNGTINYEPTQKPLCRSPFPKIDVEEIVDVRKGWKTDTFNRIARDVHRKSIKRPNRPPPIEESKSFSIVYGRTKHTIDLVAPSPAIADAWVKGLSHIIRVLKSLHQEERFERWLKQQFEAADVDKNGCLNFEECLILLKQLNVKVSPSLVRRMFEAANTNKNTRDGEQVLDSEEFVAFYMNLMSRPEVKLIFDWYAKRSGEMEWDELCEFLKKEQKMANPTKELALSLIETFEQSDVKNAGKLTPVGFIEMLMAEDFEIFNKNHHIIYQDMTRPLSHYFIASSHNTYLTGGQLKGESSVEGYIDALRRGCRCVELDCWDGQENEPIVYHGYTLTTKILFRDVLEYAIKPYAFEVSVYPVVLSLEVHCSEKQQEVLASHIKNILGEMLYTEPVNEELEFLPSPESLKKKIIVKAKKLKSSPLVSLEEGEESTTDTEAEETSAKEERGKKQKAIAEGLSSLVNICQATHFYDFQTSLTKGKYYQMSSFSEAKAERLIDSFGSEFVKYNTKQLSRIYPSAKRATSSNFKPVRFWNVGCQFVALNYQGYKKPVFINEARFEQNGCCGYVLKPEFLTDLSLSYNPDDPPLDKYRKTLILEIISGQHIPRSEQNSENDIIDPYVKVKIIGHPLDKQTQKTAVVRDNGFNPNWSCEMKFTVTLPQLAMVHFIVKDDGRRSTLGTYALPFDCLNEGYRHIFLKDYTRTYVSPASLFVHVTIEKEVS